MADKDDSDWVMTPVFRVSFPHVFKATRPKGSDKDKFTLSMLFDDDADLSKLKKAATAAVKEKWGDKPPKKLKTPFLDAGDYDYEGYEDGHALVRASSIQKPGVVDQNVDPIIEESEFYPGCYARAKVRAFTYDIEGNRGVSFGLGNIQKVKDGERLGGHSKPEDDFEAVGDDDMGDESADSLFG